MVDETHIRNLRTAAAFLAIPLSVLGSTQLWTGAQNRGEWILAPVFAASIAGLVSSMIPTIMGDIRINRKDQTTLPVITIALFAAGIALWLIPTVSTTIDTWWQAGVTLFAGQWRATLIIIALALAIVSFLSPTPQSDAQTYSRRIQ